MTPTELKTYRDLKNSMDTAKEQGVEIGARKKEIEIIHRMLELNLAAELIQKVTGSSQEEIEQLRHFNKKG